MTLPEAMDKESLGKIRKFERFHEPLFRGHAAEGLNVDLVVRTGFRVHALM